MQFAASEYGVAGDDTFEIRNLAYTISLSDSGRVPGLGQIYKTHLSRDGDSYLSLIFRKTQDAVFVLHPSQSDEFTPAPRWIRLIELPLREGAIWFGDPERSVSFEVIDREDVETSLGVVRDCFRIRIHAEEPFLMDIWLAPDIGIVRWRRRLSATRFELSERVLDSMSAR